MSLLTAFDQALIWLRITIASGLMGSFTPASCGVVALLALNMSRKQLKDAMFNFLTSVPTDNRSPTAYDTHSI